MTKLLSRAQRALTDDPAKALQITDTHRRRFPDGALRQEREAHAIDALSRLGRTHEAHARTTAFRSRYPDSSYSARIRASLARLESSDAGTGNTR